jgi:ferric iron reductase protein FhuF
LILERLVNPVIEALAVNAKLPPVISWENLFGYALWMYVNVLKETKDLRLLTGYERFLRAGERNGKLQPADVLFI